MKKESLKYDTTGVPSYDVNGSDGFRHQKTLECGDFGGGTAPRPTCRLRHFRTATHRFRAVQHHIVMIQFSRKEMCEQLKYSATSPSMKLYFHAMLTKFRIDSSSMAHSCRSQLFIAEGRKHGPRNCTLEITVVTVENQRKLHAQLLSMQRLRTAPVI